MNNSLIIIRLLAVCFVTLLAGQSAYADDADEVECEAYVIAPGTSATMPQNSFAFVPMKSKLFTLKTQNTVNLDGNENTVIIKRGSVRVTVPRDASGQWDNLVTTCPGDSKK